MTDQTPATDFIESFKRSMRSLGWSEEKIDSMEVETWTDGKHIRATIKLRGVVVDARLPKTAGQTKTGSEAGT